MKKFSNTDSVERFAMANCAMILNSRAESRSSQQAALIFKCKTCKRRFASVQALGGHAASHKRPKLRREKKLPKAYNCSVCSAQFGTGQALGGHMKKHRGAPKIHDFLGSNDSFCDNSSTVTTSDGHSHDLKMVTSICFRKGILGLDLNLSPEENELKLFDF